MFDAYLRQNLHLKLIIQFILLTFGNFKSFFFSKISLDNLPHHFSKICHVFVEYNFQKRKIADKKS